MSERVQASGTACNYLVFPKAGLYDIKPSCRGYLAFLSSPIIQQNDALPFIPFVPSAIRQIVAGIEAVFVAVSVSLTSLHRMH